YPARTPCPDLWADEINHRDVCAVEFPRQPQIEIRKINKDRGIRPALLCLGDHVLELAPNGGKVGDDFNQAYDCHLTGVDKKLASGDAHLVAAHAKKFCPRRELLQ